MKGSIAGHIWSVMSRINVNDHIEKKGNLSYLSWSWAWSELMARFPDSEFTFTDRQYDDGTFEVTCHLTIKADDQSMTRTMWLPVMDHRNNAIANPNARQISDTKMRCLVKCIAIATGLGLYIYAGEDLPQAESEAKKEASEKRIDKKQLKLMSEGIQHAGTDVAKLLSHYKVNKLDELTVPQYEQAMHFINQAIAKNAATEQVE